MKKGKSADFFIWLTVETNAMVDMSLHVLVNQFAEMERSYNTLGIPFCIWPLENQISQVQLMTGRYK